ncbi:flagellar hook-associated protein FlgK [Vibrio amylolyticus]|uniref:flagellar hook-associated protein FlgK n=1 Tax=Vibrio amylolyticus TaxID=2847292 RepID=UPI00354E0EE5
MSLMKIGFSGVQVSEIEMNVMSQNVKNINTAGYSRHQAVFGVDMNDAGNGVKVTSLHRIADQYRINQLYRASSMLGQTLTSYRQLQRLEMLLSADSMNLDQGFNKFFSSLISGDSASPGSLANRLQMISEAEALANLMNQLSSSVDGQFTDLNQQRMTTVAHCNSLLDNISKLNEKIRKGEVSGENTASLRDVLINELSKVVEVRITDPGDGTLELALPNGEPLINGNQTEQFVVSADLSYPQNQILLLSFNGQNFRVNSQIGGRLGAYERDVLASFQESINDIALEFATAFNDQLGQDFDQNGIAGKPLFVFDPANPAASMSIDPDFKPEDLALSGDGTLGDNGNLLKFDIAHLGLQTFGRTYTSMLGDIAMETRQAESDHAAASDIYVQATIEKLGTSGVNLDEEAVSLMKYQQAHQVNLQVINTANKTFAAVMQLF